MERSQRPYAIYKRITKKKKSDFRFYVRFRSEEGRYLTGVSSGQSSRAAAANCAGAELAKGRIIAPGKRGVTFGTFVEGFWNYEGYPVEGISPVPTIAEMSGRSLNVGRMRRLSSLE